MIFVSTCLYRTVLRQSRRSYKLNDLNNSEGEVFVNISKEFKRMTGVINCW